MRVLCAVLGLAYGTVAVAQTTRPTDPVDFRKIIEQAKDQVYPALVFVKPISEDFSRGERKRVQVFGSGVIITPDGVVVSNHHVIDKAIQINCVLWDKRQVTATLVGSDQETDLAVLQLDLGDDASPLPRARFADSDAAEAGQFVMALGAPFGFQRSISLGILSNTERYIGFRTMYKYNTWFQTDASINPGNSGGPLVNTEGAIIGINTLGTGGEIGFSIPSNVVQDIVRRIRKDGKVIRSWTGLELQALHDFDSNTFIREVNTGVLISGVAERSPAADADVKSGDILLAVNDQPVNGKYAELLPLIRWHLADLPPDRPVTLTLQRAGQPVAVKLVPVRKGKVEGDDFDCRRWNMTVKEINKHTNPSLYFHVKKGLFIQAVRYPGNANAAGLQAGDILLTVDRQKVTTAAEIKALYEKILADTTREKKVLLELLREGAKRWVVLDYSKDYDEDEEDES